VTRYRFDPDRSTVSIEASSSVHPIHSRTSGVEGFVDVDVVDGRVTIPSDGAGFVSLPVERLSSGNPLEDRELRRRIDARRHPTIEGQVTSTAPGADGHVHVRGDVTFRGVTCPHEGDITFTVDDDGTLHLHGSTTFDVRDFGMEPPRILLLRVHPEVTVTLDAVAVPAD